MTTGNIENRIKELFVEELAIEDSEVTMDLAYGDIAEWDSIAHINLIAAFEDEFDISLDDDEIAALSPYSKLVSIIVTKVSENG